jgi:acyl-CoA thioesterase
MTQFDDDTALRREGDVWRGEVGPRWHIVAGPNGGYVASFPLRAMLELSPFPDPLTMTTHYVQRPVYGPATVRASVNQAGRGHAFLEARMEQEHGVVVTAMAIFGTHRHSDLETVDARMPDLPPVDDTPAMPPREGPEFEFVHRFEYRLPLEHQAEVWGPAPAPAHIRGWVRLVDRDLDALAVPLFTDCFPSAIFATHGLGQSPTLELTVHWRSRPRTRWHAADFRTRFLMGGYIEEDGLLWGEDGRLVAQSRQFARFTPMPS